MIVGVFIFGATCTTRPSIFDPAELLSMSINKDKSSICCVPLMSFVEVCFVLY